MTLRRARVLFLCTGNSCRSQMAEGWARALRSDRFDASSAGTAPQALHPLAVEVMAERGVDISAQRSRSVEGLLEAGERFDCVYTVCDAAHESCPFFPGSSLVRHRGFDDPAAASGTRAERRAVFRRVRDEIREWVEGLAAEVGGEEVGAGD